MKSPMGLGRVKTTLAMSPLAGGPSGVSGHDRGDQWLDPDDVHDPGQIIGENREGHLGGYFWKRFCEEVRRPHAGFHRAEWMFDGLAPLPHGQGIVVEAPLHFFQHVLMLPARNSPLLAGLAGQLPPAQPLQSSSPPDRAHRQTRRSPERGYSRQ